MTSELSVTGGCRKHSVRKKLKIIMKEKKVLNLQFHKLYDSTWVITTDFCSINLVEGEANETPRETIFIYDPFHEASYRENSNEIKYPLSFVQDCCDLMSQPFVKVNFIALTWHYAIILAYCELQGVSFEKLVLPHDDVGQSLYTFLKGGYIPEALLSNTNPNNWEGIH